MEIKCLPCPVCTTPHFRNVDTLRSTLVKAATNLIRCPICFESLMGLDKLTIHLFSHVENRDKTNTAVLVDEIEEKIEKESLKNADDPVKCDICSFTFADRQILDIHQKLLHQTTPDATTGCYSYHCHLCNKKFKSRGSLMVHLRVAHYGFNRSECQGGRPEKPDVPGDAVECKEAKPLVDADEKDGKSNEKCGQKCQDNKQWECDVCSKLFTTKYFLKKHKRLHTGEMPYSCNLCNKSFTFQQSYHKHMLYHSADKPHTCNECGRSFKELSTLQNHARIHSGERPFICETCGKSFRQRVSYLVHRRIHTGVMPYKCLTCDKSFRYKVSQKSHKCLASSPGNASQSDAFQSPVKVKEPNPASSEEAFNTANASSRLLNSVKPEQLSVIDNTFATAEQGTFVVDNSPNKLSVAKNIMNVDFETGTISLISQTNRICSNESSLQKKSIKSKHKGIGCNQGRIKNGNLLNGSVDYEVKSSNCEAQDGFEKLIQADAEKDVFSPLMSNLLPDVESLYLNNSPMNDEPDCQEQENINYMREKCLEELLKGIE
ncbi:unnamed protein product [Phyllotreta striolata]|uniref:C2H2-type domain-containing protein n=1 Tax=Phyllotreta striolata TaxID=444603 RepID=A0A9N9TRV6_PHYSR|nr:unnamed protein product [Phyllotreta striolata]